MPDFSKVSDGGSAPNQMQDLPDGTMMVCVLHLTDMPYSTLLPGYLVRNQWDGKGLVEYHYDLDVVSPAQYKGRVLHGHKPVYAELQRKHGVNIPELEKSTRKGDLVVRAVIAFDAKARNIPANLNMDSYDDLEGKYCAVQVATWQGHKYLSYLDPIRAKDSMTCDLLINVWRQDQMAASSGLQPQMQPPPQPAAPVQQSMQPQRRQAPMQQPLQQQPYYQQQSNGWPQPQAGTEDDIPF